MLKYLAIAILGLSLTGCMGTDMFGGSAPLELFNQVVEKGKAVEGKTFDAAADAIDAYCLTAPEDVRLYLRDGVNSRTERGDIVVTCE